MRLQINSVKTVNSISLFFTLFQGTKYVRYAKFYTIRLQFLRKPYLHDKAAISAKKTIHVIRGLRPPCKNVLDIVLK